MSLLTDLRLGVRRLVKDRGASAAAICALALSLAAVNTILVPAAARWRSIRRTRFEPSEGHDELVD